MDLKKRLIMNNKKQLSKPIKRLESHLRKINCTGFKSSLSLVESLFENYDGYPLLNNFDESTKTKNLFLTSKSNYKLF